MFKQRDYDQGIFLFSTGSERDHIFSGVEYRIVNLQDLSINRIQYNRSVKTFLRITYERKAVSGIAPCQITIPMTRYPCIH